MTENIQVGDIVVSTSGRDKDKYFLVVDVDDKFVKIVNGKQRKLSLAKIKNQKHIKSVQCQALVDLAMRIRNGETLSNAKLYKAINLKTIKK